MVEVVETLETKLKRHEDALVACMTEITRLREENARLRSEKSDAMSVVREIYNDPNASPSLRLKACGLALPHEVPRLTPVPPAMTLVANADDDSNLPLAELVEKRRKRCDEAYAKDPQFQAWRDSRGYLLTGNGSGDDGNGGNGDGTGS
jgi:FtsZ-binding cell division protein ZapB